MSILYKATRVGQYGKTFTLYKFRTMVEGADKIGGSSTSDTDPRITRIGKFLRKTKLDELPQLANILRGDMVLVGWRPESPEYVHTIPDEVLRTKPGIIGYATLHDMDEGAFLKDFPDPDAAYRDLLLPLKRANELWYVRNKCLYLDLYIIFATIKKLIFRA